MIAWEVLLLGILLALDEPHRLIATAVHLLPNRCRGVLSIEGSKPSAGTARAAFLFDPPDQDSK